MRGVIRIVAAPQPVAKRFFQAGNSLMTTAEPVLPTELCSRLKTVAPQKKMMARKLRTTPIVYRILL